MEFLIPCLLLLVQKFDIGFGELFTSNAHLQTALYAERDIGNLLLSYAEQEEARLQKIRQLANDYLKHSDQALESRDQYLGNPINAFLLIKRFTLDWDRDLLPVLSNNTWQNMNQEIERVRSDLPSYEDLKGAAAALMRLQDTYHLDTSKVARGDLGGVNSPILSADECFELGRLSYNEGDFYHTTLWMQQALHEHDASWETEEKQKGDDEDEDVEFSNYERGRAELLDYLAFSQYKCDHLSRHRARRLASENIRFLLTYIELGDVPKALELTNELLSLDPNHERASNNKKYFESMMQDESRQNQPPQNAKPGYIANRDEYRNSDEFLTYEALCRGENVVAIKDKDKLTCQYVTKNHPLLLLQPAKEETVHLDPWVVIYHDVVNDEDIKQIQHLATPRLNRATVQNAKTGALETANYRISKSAWLKGEEHPVVEKLNQKMAAITGLELETAEELQIANYGLGGHYEPHFDFARRKKKSPLEELYGNRIATFLNYLSDVEAGGATVFPYLGLKLFPKKGAAAFWFNLYKNGDGIYNTRHAACPVLVGTKWVANKWIHERGQEFKRPCGLEADE